MDSLVLEEKIENIKDTIRSIEAKLEVLKKTTDNLSRMRVQVAYMQSDLMTVIDANTWDEVSEFIGLTGRLYYIDLDENKP